VSSKKSWPLLKLELLELLDLFELELLDFFELLELLEIMTVGINENLLSLVNPKVVSATNTSPNIISSFSFYLVFLLSYTVF